MFQKNVHYMQLLCKSWKNVHWEISVKVSNIDAFTKEMFIIMNSQNSYILMHLLFNTFDESENMQGESLYVTEG